MLLRNFAFVHPSQHILYSRIDGCIWGCTPSPPANQRSSPYFVCALFLFLSFFAGGCSDAFFLVLLAEGKALFIALDMCLLTMVYCACASLSSTRYLTAAPHIFQPLPLPSLFRTTYILSHSSPTFFSLSPLLFPVLEKVSESCMPTSEQLRLGSINIVQEDGHPLEMGMEEVVGGSRPDPSALRKVPGGAGDGVGDAGCTVSAWGSWSECAGCGLVVQRRYRTVEGEPGACPLTYEARACNGLPDCLPPPPPHGETTVAPYITPYYKNGLKLNCNNSKDVIVYLDGAPFAKGYAKTAWRALYNGKHVVVKRPIEKAKISRFVKGIDWEDKWFEFLNHPYVRRHDCARTRTHIYIYSCCFFLFGWFCFVDFLVGPVCSSFLHTAIDFRAIDFRECTTTSPPSLPPFSLLRTSSVDIFWTSFSPVLLCARADPRCHNTTAFAGTRRMPLKWWRGG